MVQLLLLHVFVSPECRSSASFNHLLRATATFISAKGVHSTQQCYRLTMTILGGEALQPRDFSRARAVCWFKSGPATMSVSYSCTITNLAPCDKFVLRLNSCGSL
jgi:hypothetical protein